MIADPADRPRAICQINFCLSIQREADSGIVGHLHRAGRTANNRTAFCCEHIILISAFGDRIVAPAQAFDPYFCTVHRSERYFARCGSAGWRRGYRRVLRTFSIITIFRNC